MTVPSGYTALDLIGFTDKGTYSSSATYVKNDIVTYSHSKWLCKVDDTTGITPAEGANWTLFIEAAASFADMEDVNLSSPSGGQIPVYNGTSHKWENKSIDATPTNGSNLPVSSDGVYDALATKQDTLSIDNVPTSGSNNPVKSGGVYSALAGKQDSLSIDVTPTSGSGNPVSSNGVYNALALKQNTLSFDDAPTSASNNPVKSGGVYTALSGKAPTSHASSATTYGVGSASNYGHVKVDATATENSTNAVASGDVYSLKQALNDEVVTRSTLGAKNLLSNTATTMTYKGVTFTVASNGKVTVSASSASTGDSNLTIGTCTLKAGTYRISGMPSTYNGGNTTMKLVAKTVSGSTQTAIGWEDRGKNHDEMKTYTFTSDTNIVVYLYTYSGNTYNNILVAPMITLATDSDTTYQPYSMTNQQLTTELTNKYLYLGNEKIGASTTTTGSYLVKFNEAMSAARAYLTNMPSERRFRLSRIQIGNVYLIPQQYGLYLNTSTFGFIRCFTSSGTGTQMTLHQAMLSTSSTPNSDIFYTKMTFTSSGNTFADILQTSTQDVVNIYADLYKKVT